MANGYILNAIPLSYGAMMSAIAEMLVQAGWSYKASGDGLAGYSPTGKIFTNTEAGALGWNNARAWARLAAPDGGRELTVQHNAAAATRLKYSRAAHFIGGAPNATTTPTATDERILWGSAAGTDAAPTPNAWFSTPGLCKFHGAALGTAPYGFWFCSAATPAGGVVCGLMLDPVTSVPEDIDPVVWMIGSTGAFVQQAWGGSQSHTAGIYIASGGANQGVFGHRDAAATLFEMWFPLGYLTGPTTNHGVGNLGVNVAFQMGHFGGGQNPFNLKYDALPIAYYRFNGVAGPGLKGWSTMTRWPGLQRTHAVDTFDNKNWIAIGYLWLPWDGVTVPTN